MPTNSRVFLKPFIGGLNTEGSDTDDMVLNTSDELNCTILPEQMRGRRYGFNIEKDGNWIDTDITDNITGSVYYWKNVAKTDLDLLVCRIGDKLYFFDAAVKPITDSEPIGSVSLTDYIIDTNQFYKEKFGFTTGDGKLTVVNRWMQPVRIIYNVDIESNEDRFVIESFTLSIRDVEGVIDSWGIESAQKLIDGGNEEPRKPLSDPSWTITDSGIAKVYVSYCDTQGDCYLIPKRSGLSKRGIKIGPLTKQTVDTETHIFKDDKDIGIYQTGNDIYGGSREHYYNLLNQGWTEGDLDKFSQAMTTASMNFIWPDNTMAVSVGRDNTGAYNTGEVVYKYLGNTQQPRGHFVLDYFKMNRSEVSGIWDFKNASTADYSYQYTWIKKRHLRGVTIYNHSTTVEDSQGILSRVVLKWTKLYRKSGKKSSDLHWRGPITIKIYGLLHNEWTLITTRNTFSDDGASSTDPFSHSIEVDGQTTEYEKFKVDVEYGRGNASDSADGRPYGVTVKVAVFTNDQDSGDYFSKQGDSSRITDVAYMSGKYFYLCKDSVLFSQTVKEDGTGFDLCYQNADPTSTEVSDVVTTDGGYVKFNTMGRGMALKTFNRGVLVFGRDVVYGLISPIEGKFTATDYDILELSRAGLIGSESVVSTTQQVYYWSPTGIYTIGVNPETGSTIFAQSISLNTIQTFYNNLPIYSKEHCKGVYDYTTNRIYWYYPTDEEHLNNLDGCLVYDITYNCFMPQQISQDILYNTGFLEHLMLDVADVSQSYEIEPTYYLRAGGVRVSAGGDKVLVSDETSTDYHRWTSIQHLVAKRVDDKYQFSIGDFNDREFHDWEFQDYKSYVVSRPITLGDTYFNKQTPIMQTLFKRTEEHKLKKLVKDPYETIYSLDSIFNHIESNQSMSYTWLLNKGSMQSLQVTLDLRKLPAHVLYSRFAVTVRGYDSNGYAGIVAQQQYTQEILGQNQYTVDVPITSTENYDKFLIIVTVLTGITDHYRIPTKSTIVLQRSDLEEPIFKGMKEVAYSGTTKMVYNETENKYYTTIDTVDGVLKSATVTYSPLINAYFVTPEPTYSWTATGLVYSSGISDTVSMGSPTLSGEVVVQSLTQLVSSITFGLNELTVTGGGVLYDHTVNATYSFSYLVPEYEEFSYYLPGEYTTPSGAIIRMRWGWSVNPLSNRWDMMQNGYRPQKDFLHDDYVESRLHIRGRGKAFQIEIRNDDNKDFRLTGLNIITRSPQ